MIRRYVSMKPSRGTVIGASLRAEVYARDGGCVGPRVGMEGPCFGQRELDHVLSGGLGRKSPSIPEGLVQLCSVHHREKTENGRKYRPLLLDYIASRGGTRSEAPE